MIGHEQMLELKRWNTPTIYNGWEQITKYNVGADCFNIEETRDFMPQMGPMVGRAITVVIEPSNSEHREKNPDALAGYREYIASFDGPKIVVVQDLDKPRVVGSFWGEVNSNMHKAFGCVGTITDGAIRDVDEMINAGFKALARRFCVGHAFSYTVKWNCEVEVFGRTVLPGQLIHADKHGFLVVPEEDEDDLLDAAVFMDSNECQTVIPASRGSAGKTKDEIQEDLTAAGRQFSENVKKKFTNRGEW
ncbi:MAG: RraA family protein [Spirochaetales bacterium]|jgi:4-hydroxy-4-methyl-2-oxoglutarate aldolase|nr:RraA family protein [Spirochaetales bacterium]